MEITYKMNEEQNGVEIYFTDKPSEEVRETLKAHKFRWAKYKKCWYAKQNENTISFAKSLTEQEAVTEMEPVTFEEINIDDIETYTISQDIQDREHDSAWIFRRERKDRTKEIQELFSSYNEKVVKELSYTDNELIIHKLKSSLQRFKKKYHETYIKYLTAKGNNPSWAVTGRAGLNVSRYNKGMNRIDKLMHELCDLTKGMDDTIDSYERKIVKLKDDQIKREVASTQTDIAFKMETKEFTYMNMNEKKRVHVYGEYWIAKLWGCFRIFKGGKEVHSLKTTQKLNDAKQYVAYLINQQQEVKAI